jgi:hypothetical protein
MPAMVSQEYRRALYPQTDILRVSRHVAKVPTAGMTPSGLRNLNSCSPSVQFNQRECQLINWL